MIEQLQSGAHSAVSVISSGNDIAQDSVEKSAVVGEALSEISQDITSVSDMSMQIASATEEQSATVDLINKNVDSINQSFADVTETSHQVQGSSSELKAVADDMHNLIKTFKV
jgi:methyl-accepting chemotaxis protein